MVLSACSGPTPRCATEEARTNMPSKISPAAAEVAHDRPGCGAAPHRIRVCGTCSGELTMRESVDGFWQAACPACETETRWYSSEEIAASKLQ